MTSRHLLRGATKRGVFLGGDKNESDRASDEMLTFLSPRPIENHDPCSKLRRKTTTKTKKSRDTIVVAFVFLLTYYLSFSWTTTSGGSRAQHERVVGTRVGIASEICKTRESGEGTRVEAVWISRRRTPFGRKPYWTPSFGIFFPASGVFFVVVIVRYWCVLKSHSQNVGDV